PKEVAKAKKQYPSVKFTYGEPFGIHERLTDSLQARIIEKQQPKFDASVLLIGRGSSDSAVKRDLAKIAAKLRTKYPYAVVDTCS
ncbi:sirohydrochlorin chelatase, partial [Lysinibacillus fusiformis]|uniref:sirohydrochlorin chelatase n=1 Tax=Lysinibacillus fusiformis TaxID=28031 RepID=UPI003B96F52B